jgi:hypothetical protein
MGMASKPTSRGGRERDKALAKRFRHIHDDWARRHPELAREERALRKAHAVAQRDFGGKPDGTPETHAKAARTHQGALARLFMAGHLSIDQLASGEEIRAVHERIGRDVAIGTMSMETRVDQSRSGDGTFFERLGAVRSEVAYTRWRQWLGRSAGVVLAVLIEDLACRSAAQQWHMRDATARGLLSGALDAWRDFIGEACDEIDEATLLAAQAGILA